LSDYELPCIVYTKLALFFGGKIWAFIRFRQACKLS